MNLPFPTHNKEALSFNEDAGPGSRSHPSSDSVRIYFSLGEMAAAVSPLHRCFSFPVTRPFVSPCIRCPNCKGCQLHMQFCSGAYGLRHTLAWIVRRQPPAAEERRTIKLRSQPPSAGGGAACRMARRVCRFEVAPVVITQHIIHVDYNQTIDTARHGGSRGPFAGMVCPRPQEIRSIYSRIFHEHIRTGGSRLPFRHFQRTAMRSLAGEAQALWEKLTFAPEGSRLDEPPMRTERGDKVPRRVPIGWKCPMFFVSLLPRAAAGNNGITFKLWLPEALVHDFLTAHIVEVERVRELPHTCRFRCLSTDTMLEVEDAIASVNALLPRWEGELKCPRCYGRRNHWGFICNRHRRQLDPIITLLRVRQSSVRRRVQRRAELSGHVVDGAMKNEVVWMNKRKTRAQVMALMLANRMPTTVCGPFRQRHLPAPPSFKEGCAR
ncbi:uncharacterized protein TEOVI_000070100 [Trypanosoma equiperdum]|uniref:Uncharacterized protein n=1 Tax=Trypanosoma equiperdum TaxID=5694 RepID=A0A1G4IAP6_TRYEQ|nr:hypothetical protein, conserved [Trypanosoma equiperdum]